MDLKSVEKTLNEIEEKIRKLEYSIFFAESENNQNNTDGNQNGKQTTTSTQHQQQPVMEDPATFNRIIAALKKQNIDFKHLHHEAVLTSEQAAKVRGTNLQSM